MLTISWPLYPPSFIKDSQNSSCCHQVGTTAQPSWDEHSISVSKLHKRCLSKQKICKVCKFDCCLWNDTKWNDHYRLYDPSDKCPVGLTCLLRHVPIVFPNWSRNSTGYQLSLFGVNQTWAMLDVLTSPLNNHRLLRRQTLLPVSTLFSKQPATARSEWVVRGRMGVVGVSLHPCSAAWTVFLNFYLQWLGPVKMQ